MKLKIFIIALLATFASQYASAQRVKSWSSQISHEARLDITGMASDQEHTYITGTFSDSLFIAGTLLKTSEQAAIYLAKLDNNGLFVWAGQTGSNGNSQASAILAKEKKIFLAGLISDTIHADEKKNHSNTKLFISAWNTQGEEEWMLKFEYTGRASLDVLEAGPGNTIIAGGLFHGSINIDGVEFDSRRSSCAFVIIFSPAGEVLQTFTTKGKGNHRAIAACKDDDENIFLMFASTPGSLIIPVTGKDIEQRFTTNGLLIAKFNPALQLQWAAPISSSGFIEGIRLNCGINNNVYAGINFNRDLKIENTGLKTESQLATALLSFGRDGQLLNHNLIDNQEYCRLTDMALPDGKDILLTGYYHGGFLFEEFEPEPSENRRSAFIAQLDTDARVVWYDDIELTTDQSGRALSFNAQGDILIAGASRQHQDFSTSSQVTVKNQNGVFVNRYHLCRQLNLLASAPEFMCPGDTAIINATAGFESYIWNNIPGQGNAFSITEPGTYIVQAFDNYGCHGADTITIGLYPQTKSNIGGEFTLAPGEYLELIADSAYAEYSWSDNFPGRRRLISHKENTGHLEIFLYAKANGHCPVCDTLIINFADIPEAYGLVVYPNPVRNDLQWSWVGSEQELFEITLLDTRGVVLYQTQISETVSHSEGRVNMDALNPGTYILKLHTATGFYNRIIVKQ